MPDNDRDLLPGIGVQDAPVPSGKHDGYLYGLPARHNSTSSSGASSLESSSSSSSSGSSSGSDDEGIIATPRPALETQMSTDSHMSDDSGYVAASQPTSVPNGGSHSDNAPVVVEMAVIDEGSERIDEDAVDMGERDGPPYEIPEVLAAPLNLGGLKLLLQLAMHRFFTFPLPAEWRTMCEDSSRDDLQREELANSGFFMTADTSGIQCFYCRLKVYVPGIISRDESVDDAHKRLSPNCPLMKGEATQDVPINDPTNYRYESHRLYSLLIQDWTAPITPYDLAKYGFYWTGSSDNCRCAFCRLEVRGWEEGDRAESEHRRWNPNCVFINGRSVGNVELGKELDITQLVNDEAGSYRPSSTFSINPFARSEMSTYGGQVKYTKTGRQIPVESLGVTPMNPPRHPDHITLTKRLDSFKLWPMCLPQRPEQLAEAGFYYTGAGDRVICFQCGGGLKDWAPSDTPWSEHAKWFSRCPYLVLKKGKEFVDKVLKDQKIEMPIQAFADELRLQKEQEKKETVDEPAKPLGPAIAANSLRCRKCGERDVETVNLPCGHMVTCEACVESVDKCLRCNADRVAYVRTFLQ